MSPQHRAQRRSVHRPRQMAGIALVLCLIALAGVMSSGTADATQENFGLSPSFVGAPYFAPGSVYGANFPDPSVVWDPDTQRYYAFSTATGGVYVPVMWSTDLVTWTARSRHSIVNPNGEYHDALPDPSPTGTTWTSNNPRFPDELWAPSVAKLSGNGASAWFMFYSLRVNQEGKRCIFYATSQTADGPYTAPSPMYCGNRPMGYIDPQVFVDGNKTWLVLKDEGEVGVAWSAIWAREITVTGTQSVAWKDADGTPNGWFTPLLQATGGWDRGVVENPSVVRLSDGVPTLFYSGGLWNFDEYSMGIAVCGEFRFSWTPICTRVGTGQIMGRRQGMKGIGGSTAFRGAGDSIYLANHYWDDRFEPNYPVNQRRLVVDRAYEAYGGLVFTHDLGPTGVASRSGYVVLSPTRVLDTRQPVGVASNRALEAGEVFALDVSSQTTATTTAVTMNVTVDGASAPGYITAYACGEPPLASNLNYERGSPSTNQVTVRVNNSRKVCFYAQSSTHLIVDMQGRFDSNVSAGITPVTPTRVLDTRTGASISASGTIDVSIVGRAGVPAGATAALVSITADGAAGAGYLTAWQCGDPRPTVSNVNYAKTLPSGNGAIVPLSLGGSLCIFSQSRTDVIVDVFGYVGPNGQRLNISAPTRVFDSRLSTVVVDGGQTIPLQVTGAGRASTGSTAVEVNVTATEARAPGWVSVFPCSFPPAPGSETSVLNLVAGQTKAAHVVVPVGTAGPAAGQICLRTQNPTHLVVDLSGGYS